MFTLSFNIAHSMRLQGSIAGSLLIKYDIATEPQIFVQMHMVKEQHQQTSNIGRVRSERW